jgi:hypothetical protein
VTNWRRSPPPLRQVRHASAAVYAVATAVTAAVAARIAAVTAGSDESVADTAATTAVATATAAVITAGARRAERTGGGHCRRGGGEARTGGGHCRRDGNRAAEGIEILGPLKRKDLRAPSAICERFPPRLRGIGSKSLRRATRLVLACGTWWIVQTLKIF